MWYVDKRQNLELKNQMTQRQYVPGVLSIAMVGVVGLVCWLWGWGWRTIFLLGLDGRQNGTTRVIYARNRSHGRTEDKRREVINSFTCAVPTVPGG